MSLRSTPPSFQQRLHSGHDLYRLRMHIGGSMHDLTYALGLTRQNTNEIIKQSQSSEVSDVNASPLKSPTLSLLIWALQEFPEYNYMPVFPDSYSVYENYAELAGRIEYPVPKNTPSQRKRTVTLNSHKAFGFMLGRDHVSGIRWIKGQTIFNSMTSRLAYFLNEVCLRYGEKGLREWHQRVLLEASWRGIYDLWMQNKWYVSPDDPLSDEGDTLKRRRMRYRDIKQYQLDNNLKKQDVSYLLGNLTEWHKDGWGIQYKNNPDMPIIQPTMALLVWALHRYPEISYQPKFTTIADAFDLYKGVVNNKVYNKTTKLIQNPVKLDGGRKRGQYTLSSPRTFGIMLGANHAAMLRWLAPNKSGVVAPTIRLNHILSQVLKHNCYKGFETWFNRVSYESIMRGIDDIWVIGHWYKSSK